MIVYSSLLHLVDRDPRPAVREALRIWLGQKTGRGLGEASLRQGSVDLGQGHLLEVEEFEYLEEPAPSARPAEHDWVVAFRYSHPDHRVSGRRWVTEIGVGVSGSRSLATVRLATEEQSALANKQVATSRPRVVDLIQQNCTLHAKTPGRNVRMLRLHDVEGFVAEMRNVERRHPVFVLSPHQEGGHAVDPGKLASLCIGIADVVAIPDGEDTYALERALGRGMCPYRGAIDILWPVAVGQWSRHVPRTRILSEHFEEMRFERRDPHSELLARVCHETSTSVAGRHHDLASVRQLRLRCELDKERRQLARSATPDQLDLLKLYAEVEAQDRERIQQLESKVRSLESQLVAEHASTEEAEQAKKEAERKAEHLQQAVQAAKRGRANDGTADPRLRSAFEKLRQEKPTLEDCLVLLEHLYPDRLVILESAWRSARDAAKFHNGKRAFELLWQLCTAYHEAMVSGGGDKRAIEVFGNTSFAARESETVENNERAVSLRTFSYESQPVQMMRHLKIGVKPSDATTFRAHFHWDAAKKLVVLGHCGGHLDHD